MAYISKRKQPEKAITPDEALAKLEHFCAYRERCPQEVYRKLAELGIRGETADQIYQVLEGDGFVEEERFARAFAGGKFRVNRWGKVRIRLELQRRGIAPRLIGIALDAIGETEYVAVLCELIGKKRAQNDRLSDDPVWRSKVAASLIRAGFEPELVYQYL